MPRWQLTILMSEQQRVEAQRTRTLITAASAPHMREQARRDLLRSIDRHAAPPAPPPTPMTKERYDPDAAAAWFAARGVRVEAP